MLTLKRLYDHDAPREAWGVIDQACPDCDGKGVVINDTYTGVDPCDTCTPATTAAVPVRRGTGKVAKAVPPVRPEIRVERAGPVMHLSQGMLDGGIAEGWLSMGRGLLTLHTPDGDDDVVYRILRAPGHYCCHCGAKLDDAGRPNGADGLTEGQRHVQQVHQGAPSPDPTNPHGYRKDDFYTAVLVGSEVDRTTVAETAAVYQGIRDALWRKLNTRYTRGVRVPPPIQGGGDIVFNIAKGRVTELYIRVDTDDPANSAIVIIIWNSSATDTVIKRLDTVADVEANANTAEVTNSGYARKVLTDSDLTAFAPDDVNDRVDLDIPDQTWVAVAAGSAWTDFSTNYDNDTTGGTDANIVPMTWHDFVVTPDGSDITAQIAAAGFFRAQ